MVDLCSFVLCRRCSFVFAVRVVVAVRVAVLVLPFVLVRVSQVLRGAYRLRASSSNKSKDQIDQD